MELVCGRSQGRMQENHPLLETFKTKKHFPHYHLSEQLGAVPC